MNKERKMAIATILIAGSAILSFIYTTYGWYGVAAILGIIAISIGVLAIEEEEEDGKDNNNPN